MESIGAIAVLIADIFAIVRIVQSSAPVVNKILWSVLVLILPVVGFVIWFLIGPNNPRG